MDVSATVDRVDRLHDAVAGLAHTARTRSGPVDAVQAAERLARALEQLGGDLDAADDLHYVRALANAARLSLPAEFAAFGRAISETLLDGADIRRHGRGDKRGS